MKTTSAEKSWELIQAVRKELKKESSHCWMAGSRKEIYWNVLSKIGTFAEAMLRIEDVPDNEDWELLKSAVADVWIASCLYIQDPSWHPATLTPVMTNDLENVACLNLNGDFLYEMWELISKHDIYGLYDFDAAVRRELASDAFYWGKTPISGHDQYGNYGKSDDTVTIMGGVYIEKSEKVNWASNKDRTTFEACCEKWKKLVGEIAWEHAINEEFV